MQTTHIKGSSKIITLAGQLLASFSKQAAHWLDILPAWIYCTPLLEPASTRVTPFRMPYVEQACLQVLGAKRKTLSGFSTANAALHQGFIYACDVIQNCPEEFRNRAARLVGAKCTLLARIDKYGEDKTGSQGAQMKASILRPETAGVCPDTREKHCSITACSLAHVSAEFLDYARLLG